MRKIKNYSLLLLEITNAIDKKIVISVERIIECGNNSGTTTEEDTVKE